MHHAQLLRLTALRETLATGLEPAAAALAAADDLLARPLQIAGRPLGDGRDYVRAAVEQAESTLAEVLTTLGR